MRLQAQARTRLQRFRQATSLTVALTALLLLLWGGEPSAGQVAEDVPVAEEAIQSQELAAPAEAGAPQIAPSQIPEAALDEASSTISALIASFYSLLPKLLVAATLLLVAYLLSLLARAVLHRTLRGWERTDAISAMLRIAIMLLGIGAALSVIAGDARALVGSVGLVGLALSWALQTPIESFTGWVLNAFQSYYRPGDRIEVGDVFGDVYRIDVLTTTVWEAGGPGKHVAGAQSTGALVTIPNWEILRSNITNYSRDFPYVWDEITVGVANESDLLYSMQVFQQVAQRVLGELMKLPAAQYREILQRRNLAFDVADEPQVYLSLTDSWTNCTIRYLVPVRQRRHWATQLILALATESSRPEHRNRIIASYPRTQVELRNALPGIDSEESSREP